MAGVQQSQKHGKRCFVTIGATAPFNSLIQAVLQQSFVDALSGAGYDELRVQYGNHEGESIFQSRTKEISASPHVPKLEITGFGFDKAGLGTEMFAVKGSAEVEQGTVISHAGSGSILDALRVGVPLIVVPNTDLLHNHQAELADVLAEQEYVVHGKLDDLASSITEIESLRRKMKQWPPLRSGEEKYKNGLADVMAEEMGWQIG
ncbi:hypothetical protein LTR84_009358 [Exophiala bonariae]|uniref:UDP-N-acetylglucosamine transferase subunit ALG13 n=1 Tax=Exophiala bonariae TaxID=1690606 RepID=A0AAV9MUU8_9EURO|nr:hypothetical protein LTR84_009358 [Exophiala bonariae]